MVAPPCRIRAPLRTHNINRKFQVMVNSMSRTHLEEARASIVFGAAGAKLASGMNPQTVAEIGGRELSSSMRVLAIV